MKKHSKSLPHAPRSGVFFAPGTVESAKARNKWLHVIREWVICAAIAAAVGIVSAFVNSRF